ncbi:MAG: uracil-DNA glycosylase [Acidobacteria bacterium]|nr:MAG: uracil-DNA glycosylase [Acidobacteriota bacterium]
MRESLSEVERDVVRCAECPRLVRHREEIARRKRRAYAGETYWGRPVPGFGRGGARLVVVGLAPGAHGSNRTGRMFTGDASGDLLYRTLHRYGFASQARAVSRDDGLELRDCFVTAIVRCVPPGNRPNREEIARCRPFLLRELRLLRRARVYVALGRLAFDTLVPALREIGRPPLEERPRFRHGARFDLSGGRLLLASYHPSRQNTQTGRLTEPMFRAVFRAAREAVSGA